MGTHVICEVMIEADDLPMDDDSEHRLEFLKRIMANRDGSINITPSGYCELNIRINLTERDNDPLEMSTGVQAGLDLADDAFMGMLATAVDKDAKGAEVRIVHTGEYRCGYELTGGYTRRAVYRLYKGGKFKRIKEDEKTF